MKKNLFFLWNNANRWIIHNETRKCIKIGVMCIKHLRGTCCIYTVFAFIYSQWVKYDALWEIRVYFYNKNELKRLMGLFCVILSCCFYLCLYLCEGEAELSCLTSIALNLHILRKLLFDGSPITLAKQRRY